MLSKHYSDFWLKFAQVLHGQAVVVPQFLTFSQKPDRTIPTQRKGVVKQVYKITNNEPIYIRDLQFDKKSTKCDVRISVEEHFVDSDPSISIYTGNNIQYLSHGEVKERQTEVRLRHSLRFDYNPVLHWEKSPAHPIFHMHMDTDEAAAIPVDLSTIRKLVEPEPLHRIGEVRIPTARMCFPSLLCIVVADFYGGKMLENLLGLTQEIRKHFETPCPEWADLMGGQGRNYSGLHWYHKKVKDAG